MAKVKVQKRGLIYIKKKKKHNYIYSPPKKKHPCPQPNIISGDFGLFFFFIIYYWADINVGKNFRRYDECSGKTNNGAQAPVNKNRPPKVYHWDYLAGTG